MAGWRRREPQGGDVLEAASEEGVMKVEARWLRALPFLAPPLPIENPAALVPRHRDAGRGMPTDAEAASNRAQDVAARPPQRRSRRRATLEKDAETASRKLNLWVVPNHVTFEFSVCTDHRSAASVREILLVKVRKKKQCRTATTTAMSLTCRR